MKRMPTGLFWVSAGALAALAVWWGRPLGSELDSPTRALALPALSVGVSVESLAAAAETAEMKNPFRPDRRPALLAYGAEPAHALAPAAPSRPNLSLHGIVGGPPWSAVVKGFPGHEEALLLQPGDTIADMRVISVSAGLAVIAGADTTWVLRLEDRRP